MYSRGNDSNLRVEIVFKVSHPSVVFGEFDRQYDAWKKEKHTPA